MSTQVNTTLTRGELLVILSRMSKELVGQVLQHGCIFLFIFYAARARLSDCVQDSKRHDANGRFAFNTRVQMRTTLQYTTLTFYAFTLLAASSPAQI